MVAVVSLAQTSADGARAPGVHRGVYTRALFVAVFSETPGGVQPKYSVKSMSGVFLVGIGVGVVPGYFLTKKTAHEL